MEESWMDKLIELLNEREKTVNWVQYPWWCKEHLEYQCHWPRVINKRFWFIKWLVDNDKIDLDKRPTRNKYRLQQYKTELWWYWKIDDYSGLLMLLSIQEKPIEFLISILKD